MGYIYIITQGENNADGYFLFCSTTNEIARNCCIEDGFKFNKKDNLWEDETHWRTVESIELKGG
jgi:hypothetical protein